MRELFARYRHILVAALIMMLPCLVSAQDSTAIPVDSLNLPVPKMKVKRDWSKWKPETKRAMWLALVLPGAGQIYNRKYWKLPIIYGGAAACIYAYTWNGQMYKDYKQAYVDLTDDDPTTRSYEKVIRTVTIDDSNKEKYADLFKNRKDRFRRYRDMSLFCMIGVYALSVIDAYVDASLSEFDISDDLSLSIEPAVFTPGNSLQNASVGVQCSLSF